MKKIFYIVILLTVVMTAGCIDRMGYVSNTMKIDLFVQTYDNEKYDFLWVVDNSDSMQVRRDYIKDNLNSFVSILGSRKAVDYQMAVVTTDFFTEGGNLVSAPNGNKVVKSTSANPTADFADIMNNIAQSNTSFWEQGLESAYQAVYQHGSEFSRKDVPLIVIFVSDENDWSCKSQCWGVEPENNNHWVAFDLDRYVTYFQNVKKAENTDVSIFPIIGLNTVDCDIASVGSRYQELQAGVGNLGSSSSICSYQFQESYENIAKVIADRGNVFKLNSTSSGKGISVYVDQKLIPYSPENYIYEVETNSIIFTGAAPKKGQIVEITYVQKTL